MSYFFKVTSNFYTFSKDATCFFVETIWNEAQMERIIEIRITLCEQNIFNIITFIIRHCILYQTEPQGPYIDRSVYLKCVEMIPTALSILPTGDALLIKIARGGSRHNQTLTPLDTRQSKYWKIRCIPALLFHICKNQDTQNIDNLVSLILYNNFR